MQKIAAADLNHLMIKSAQVIRSQQSRIKELERELSNKDRYSHAEKIASIAVDRGIMSEEDAKTYADELASSDRDLSMVEEFVSRNSGAGLPLGSELTKTASGYDISDGDTAEGRFSNFLLTSDFV